MFSEEHQPARHLLKAYDTQPREEAEMVSATAVDRDSPPWRGKFDTRGFVSYRNFRTRFPDKPHSLKGRTE